MPLPGLISSPRPERQKNPHSKKILTFSEKVMPQKASYILEWNLISPTTHALPKNSYNFLKSLTTTWVNFQTQAWKNFLYFPKKIFLTFGDDCWFNRKIKKSLILRDDIWLSIKFLITWDDCWLCLLLCLITSEYFRYFNFFYFKNRMFA